MSPFSKKDPPPTFDAATEAELDRAAEITPADVARAQGQWREDAPGTYSDLLDAQPSEDTSDATGDTAGDTTPPAPGGGHPPAKP